MSANPDNRPPTELWLGMQDGEWPVRAFVNESYARHFLSGHSDHRRRVWKVRIADPVQLELVTPAPYLRPVGDGTAGGES